MMADVRLTPTLYLPVMTQPNILELAKQGDAKAIVSEACSPVSTEVTESKPLSLKERAKLGDVEAIASLLNLPLQKKGISATASL